MAKTLKRNTVKPLYIKGNVFDWGGESKTAWQNSMKTENLGETASSAVSGISGMAQAAVGNARIKDTTGLEAAIDNVANTDFNARDNTQLLSMWNNTNWANTNLKTSDLTQSTGTQVGNTLKGIGSGAMAGAQIGGPLGAVIGGAAGLVSGIGGSIFGSQKARREKNRLNALAAEANARAENNFLINMDWLNDENYYNYMRNIAAEGGQLENSHGGLFAPHGLRMIGAGGSHEENPYGGVLQGFDQEGTPNFVEKGEVIFNDYVFSNRLSPSKRILEEFGLASKYKGKTYAKIAEDLSKQSRENPNDPISKRTMESMLQRLQMTQEAQKARAEENKIKREFAKGGNLFDGTSGSSQITLGPDVFEENAGYYNNMDQSMRNEIMGLIPPGNNGVIRLKDGSTYDTKLLFGDKPNNNWRTVDPATFKNNGTEVPTYDTRARYAPIIGTGLTALQSAFERPDYQHIQPVEEYVGRMRPQTISARPIGDYIRRNPLDMNYMLNQVRSQQNATRRALTNSQNAGAVQAALLAEGMNTGSNLGAALLQGREYNAKDAKQVADFNRSTNQYNSQNGTQVDSQNAANDLNTQLQRANMMYNIAGQKTNIDNLLDTVRGTNTTAFFDNLGAMGKENFVFNQINHNPALRGYILDKYGDTLFSNAGSKKCGGKLKIKK